MGAPNDSLLVVKVRARGIAEAIPFAAIARGESLLHRHGRRIGKAPIFSHAAMQPLGAALRRLDREGLQRVRHEELALLFRLLGSRTNATRNRPDEGESRGWLAKRTRPRPVTDS